MIKKSLNRFYFLGLTLVAALLFFGVSHDHIKIHKAGAPVISVEASSIHSTCPCHQPIEIENKEEQPTTEDDESRESSSGDLTDSSLSFYLSRESVRQNESFTTSKSQTQYHTPAYVRLRSILI